jgi:hypothetical protein
VPGVQARRNRVSTVASLLLHVLFAAFFLRILAFFTPPMPVAKHEPASIITLERRLEETPKPKPTAQPRQKVAAPAPPRHLLTTPEPVAAPPHEIVVRRPVAPPVIPQAIQHGKPRLNSQQIARIQSELGDAIARDKQGLGALNVPPEPISTPKHFAHDYSAFAMGGSHGLCDPVQSWQDEGWDYYYVACNVVFDEDGHTERQNVPWPVRFRPNDDPFAGTYHRQRQLAGPLPGYTLPPGTYISKELRDYARSQGTVL